MFDGHTKLYGLLAHPAAHSLSPLIHNTGFKITGINGGYMAFDVTSENLAQSIAGIKAMEIGGVNLSMPLKTDVIPMLDAVSDRAKQLNAVNTIVNRKGKLFGDSTDGDGFIDSLQSHGISVAGNNITVLGAGGAGRAVIQAAIHNGAAKITVFKRKNATFNLIKEQLVSWSNTVEIIPYDDISTMKKALRDSTILVNTTNVGMAGDTNLPIMAEVLESLDDSLIVMDAIYFPLETPLLREAKKRGCRTFNGIGMLVCQAAGSFKQWTGKSLPVAEVTAVLNEHIKAMK